MCPKKRLAYYNRPFCPILCYKKDWDTLMHLSYYCYLSLVTNYLAIKLLVTDNFSACRKYLAENRLTSPSAPRGSTLLLIERTTTDLLYFWVIKTLFWRRCRGVKRLW